MEITLRQWLEEEPFTLSMSAGFFGFFAHCGMLSTLEREGLRPARVVGASAGGLVAGAWAAGLDARFLREELYGLRRADFWDPAPGLGFLRGTRFRRMLGELLPVARFAECRVPLAVPVFDVFSRRTTTLYEGDLATAIAATCAVPGLFQPVWVNGRPCLDGGVADRAGLSPVAQGERVLHHHLSSRSPWRRRKSPAMRVPARDNLVALVLSGLTRSGPFRLEAGRQALLEASEATWLALDRPVNGGAVTVERG